MKKILSKEYLKRPNNFGTWYTFNINDEEFLQSRMYKGYSMLKEAKRGAEIPVTQCFATYFNCYERKKKLYFVFPLMPHDYYKVVGDFNSRFRNIQIRVVDDFSEDYFFVSHEGLYKDYLLQEKEILPEYKVLRKVSFSYPIFTFDFDEKFSEKAKKYLQYNLSILLRLMSIKEGHTLEITEDICTLEDLLEINNNSRDRYRSLSENLITITNLLNLDNPIVVNVIVISEYLYRQTSLITAVEKETDGGIYSIRFDKLKYRGNAYSIPKMKESYFNSKYQQHYFSTVEKYCISLLFTTSTRYKVFTTLEQVTDKIRELKEELGITDCIVSKKDMIKTNPRFKQIEVEI